MKITGTSFIGTSIRSILDGSKTMTRRGIRICNDPITRDQFERNLFQRGIPSDAKNVRLLSDYLKCDSPAGSVTVSSRVPCPYGRIGDRLWVKETFSAHGALGVNGRITYRADLNDGPEPHGLHWKPSRFMPRAASRITLEITSIRVEQLGDISEEDAKAEGVTPLGEDRSWVHKELGLKYTPLRDAFEVLWEKVNGKGSWNPKLWVWVIGFKVLEKR